MAVHQFVKFNVDKETFGVEISQVMEIIMPQEIFKVPNAPVYVEGLINMRGNVITVFNLRKRFGMENKSFDDNTKFIIVNVNDLLIGFTVDAVSEIVRVDDTDIEPTPSSVANMDERYLSGVAKINQSLILLLDLTKVLSSEEESKLKKLVDDNRDELE